jgi:hypothetical protein
VQAVIIRKEWAVVTTRPGGNLLIDATHCHAEEDARRRLIWLRLSGRLAMPFSGWFRGIMGDVAYCNLCEMNRDYCEHGLTERRRAAAASAGRLLISPNSVAHFPQCPHKGDDPDYRRWADLDAPRAWERLGNGEELRATGGQSPDLVARTRCQTASTTGRGEPGCT